jgi:periplasmic protein TonB
VFRVDGPIDEARSEPLFLSDPGSAPPRLSLAGRSIADDVAGGRREPAAAAALPASPLPEREPPVGSRQRRRPFGPVGSLILHLLPLLLLVEWPMRPPVEVAPIPVQLVFQPPPPPPPKPSLPKPLPKPEVRPPPGRLASEDMGETKTQGQDQAKSEAAAPSKKPEASKEPPPEPQQKTAAAIPPPPVPGATGLPNEKVTEEPPRPKPKPSIHQPLLRRAEARLPLAPRPARFPGPSATKDEYLAYLVYLTRKHLNLLPMSMIAGRRGETVINILVLDNGTLARVDVGASSGYPDIDQRVEAMIRAVGRFPPLPQWFQGPSMELEFMLKFPEAMED